MNPAVTEYLVRKRSRIQSRGSECTTTEFSEGGSSEGAKKVVKKKKGKIERGATKKRIQELEEENRKLRERIADDERDEEYQPDFSLLPKKNLPSVEEFREEIRFEPHYAIEGILVECANRIHNIASCSNNIKGGLVRDLRICAR